MKFAKKLSTLLLFTAGLAVVAHAQGTQATFRLAHDTHIGTGMLPAGEYTVTLAVDGTTKAFIMPVAGHGASGMIALPTTTTDRGACSQSSLTMKRVGSEWSVTSICFAGSQIAVYFPLAPAKSELATAGPVPVLSEAAR